MEPSLSPELKKFEASYQRILAAEQSAVFGYMSSLVKELVQSILDRIIDFETSSIYMPNHEVFSSHVPNLDHENFLGIGNLRNLIQGLQLKNQFEISLDVKTLVEKHNSSNHRRDHISEDFFDETNAPVITSYNSCLSKLDPMT